MSINAVDCDEHRPITTDQLLAHCRRSGLLSEEKEQRLAGLLPDLAADLDSLLAESPALFHVEVARSPDGRRVVSSVSAYRDGGDTFTIQHAASERSPRRLRRCIIGLLDRLGVVGCHHLTMFFTADNPWPARLVDALVDHVPDHELLRFDYYHRRPQPTSGPETGAATAPARPAVASPTCGSAWTEAVLDVVRRRRGVLGVASLDVERAVATPAGGLRWSIPHVAREILAVPVESPDGLAGVGLVFRGDHLMSLSHLCNRVEIHLTDDGAAEDVLRAVAAEIGPGERALSTVLVSRLGDESSLDIPGFGPPAKRYDALLWRDDPTTGMGATRDAVEGLYRRRHIRHNGANRGRSPARPAALHAAPRTVAPRQRPTAGVARVPAHGTPAGVGGEGGEPRGERRVVTDGGGGPAGVGGEGGEPRGERRVATGGYLMEHDGEVARLEGKTVAEESARQLSLVGLRRGDRCLDVGTGSGAVARVMADLVGPKGSVVGLDSSSLRLDAARQLAAGTANLRFALHDVSRPLGSTVGPPFDLVWSRFLFEYLPEPELAIANLVGALAPGGKLVVGDLDGNCLWHHPMVPELAQGLDLITAELTGSWDPFVGRKLFSLFHRAGLRNIEVHLLPYNVTAGDLAGDALANWEAKLATIAGRVAHLFGGDARYRAFVDRLIVALRQPDLFSYSTLVIVEGTAPVT